MRPRILISLLVFGIFAIIVSVFSTPALARPVFEADGGVLLTGYTAKQVTDVIRGIINPKTTPPPEISKEIKKQLEPPKVEPPPGAGKVSLWQSWSPNPDRGIIGPQQTFRLTWSVSKNARGNNANECFSYGTWGENMSLHKIGGERIELLPASTYEGEHGYGIRCNWGGYWDKAEVVMFLDKPVQSFVSADAGSQTAVRGEITIPSGQSVRINFTGIDAKDFGNEGGPATCFVNGEEFRNYAFFEEGNIWRIQGSIVENPAKNATYTLTCSDYFSKGAQDSLTVKVGRVCSIGNECTSGQRECLNNNTQSRFCRAIADPNDPLGICYKWSEPVTCSPGQECSSGFCRVPGTQSEEETDKKKIDWDKLLKELNKTDSGTDGNGGTNGGAGGAGFPTFGSTQCYDGKDNDNDAKIDNGVTKVENGVKKYYPPDPGCLDKDGKYDPNDKFEFQYRIKEVIPDFFNLNWFKLDFVNFFQTETLAQR